MQNNKMNYVIRQETEADYRETENLIREAFWNLYAPGCDEHYLLHVMRSSASFVSPLAFVCEHARKLVGAIYYRKAILRREDGFEKTILTFGPIGVLPNCQRQGIGKRLIEHSFASACALGYDTVVIFGHPGNYVARGFVSCQRKQVYVGDEIYPTAMLVKELRPGVLDGHRWAFEEDEIEMPPDKVLAFDETFPKKERVEGTPSQEEFYIYSHSVLH